MSYSLTISWTAASPAPAFGYRIKYWPASNPSNITTVIPNVSGTTYTISGLTETAYIGTVEADCGGENYSFAQSFEASISTGGTIQVVNQTTQTVSLEFQPAWFTIDLGTTNNMTQGSIAQGSHGGFNGNFGVTITGASSGCLVLLVDGGVLQSLGVNGDGIYTFISVSIAANAVVSIEYTNVCP